ncbi:MAG: N-acetylmuramoyl-L-alanine amidase [Oscillospiraceae bacterium]|nr:N-acetylmuramoyl-L-alanine amidase [Oscillospiraceae bacterium]
MKRVIVGSLAVIMLFMALGGAYFFFRGQAFIGAIAEACEQRLLIIDPGHGGADGGAVGVTGIHESEINLAVGLRLEALAALYGIPTEMTRRTAELDYPESATTIRAKKVADTRARVELINNAANAVVISIHQNTYDGPGASGPQVLFAATEGSEAFAEQMQAALTIGLGLERPRIPARVPSGVYVMNHINTTAILVECGFLSNPAEEALLRTEGYQLRLAAILLAGYVQSIDLFEGSGT